MSTILKTTGFINKNTGEFFEASDIIEKIEKVEIENFKYKSSSEVIKLLGNFNWFYYKELLKLDIGDQYKFRVIYLSTYMNYDNKLMLNHKSELKRKDFNEILNLGERQVKDTLKVLIDNSIIFKKDNCYYISSKIFKKGKIRALKADKEITKSFVNGIRELYLNTDTRSHRANQVIFNLLPYVNVNHNLITLEEYTKEYDLSKIKPARIEDIAVNIGINPKNRKKILDNLMSIKVFGEYVFMYIRYADKEFVYINPRIYYSNSCKDKKQLDLLLESFDMLKNML